MAVPKAVLSVELKVETMAALSVALKDVNLVEKMTGQMALQLVDWKVVKTGKQ
jgi:hypothetical protein